MIILMTVNQNLQVRKYPFIFILYFLIYWLKFFIINKIPKYFRLFWSIYRVDNRCVRGYDYLNLAFVVIGIFSYIFLFKSIFIFALLYLVLKLLFIVLLILLLIWIVLLLSLVQRWRVDDWPFFSYIRLCLLWNLLQWTNRNF